MYAIWIANVALASLALGMWWELRRLRRKKVNLKSRLSQKEMLAFGFEISDLIIRRSNEGPIAESILGSVCAGVAVRKGNLAEAIKMLRDAADRLENRATDDQHVIDEVRRKVRAVGIDV